MNKNGSLKFNSTNELRQKVLELDKLALKDCSFEEVFEKTIEVFSGIVVCRIKLKIKKVSDDYRFGMFRARQIDGTFELNDLNSYWAKPAEQQREYGRCHSIGDSKFYGANYLLSTLLECRARIGSEWVIAEFENKDESFFESIFLGGLRSGFDRMMGHQGKLNSIFENLSKSEMKKNNFMYEYICKKLGEKVQNQKKYKITSALSKFFFKHPLNSSNVECIIYPSLMSKKRALNFAIDPQSAKEKLQIVRLYHVRVDAVMTNKGMNLKCINSWSVPKDKTSNKLINV